MLVILENVFCKTKKLEHYTEYFWLIYDDIFKYTDQIIVLSWTGVLNLLTSHNENQRLCGTRVIVLTGLHSYMDDRSENLNSMIESYLKYYW